MVTGPTDRGMQGLGGSAREPDDLLASGSSPEPRTSLTVMNRSGHQRKAHAYGSFRGRGCLDRRSGQLPELVDLRRCCRTLMPN
jgi:hypothetical protein